MRTRFVDFEQRGCQRVELVDGQSAVFADYGFNCIKLDDDWRGRPHSCAACPLGVAGRPFVLIAPCALLLRSPIHCRNAVDSPGTRLTRVVVFLPAAVVKACDDLAARYGSNRSEVFRLAIVEGMPGAVEALEKLQQIRMVEALGGSASRS